MCSVRRMYVRVEGVDSDVVGWEVGHLAGRVVLCPWLRPLSCGCVQEVMAS